MAIIEQSSAKSSNKDMGLWSSLRGVPMRLIERPKNFFLRTAIRSIVDLSYTNEINDEIKAEGLKHSISPEKMGMKGLAWVGG